MGIMASAKSRVGLALASRLAGVFVEGDDLHPISNVEKMSAGVPLSDDDRRPWLEHLAREVKRKSVATEQVVFSCSALKLAYREQLRRELPDMITICLTLSAAVAVERSNARTDHFMPAELVASQLATLELPKCEQDAALVDASASFERVLANTERAINRITHSS